MEATVDLGELLEYRMKGLSYADIGEIVKLSPSTVHWRLQRHDKLLQAAADAPEFEATESKVLAGLRGALLARAFACATAESGSDDELSGYQAMGMYGIAFDKSRTLEGKSNYHIAVLSQIINKSEQSGDSALRKLTVEPVKIKPIE
jgi:hypothetical protein